MGITRLRHGSLFSGIGGFDLAAEWMGWKNVFHCEWNEFGQKVLRHYWPDAELFTDITKSNFSKYHGTIDIISGGFPCQPYSISGKRLGKEDARHLWPEMLRVIREVRPRWVVGENVLGLVNWNDGLVFHEVQADLEAEGYEVQPYVLPAASVDAPHRRDRVWFVAKNTLRSGRTHGGHEQEGAEVRKQRDIGAGGTDGIHISKGDASDSERIGHAQCQHEGQSRSEEKLFKGRCIDATDTQNAGHARQPIHGQREIESNGCYCKNATDTDDKGLQRRENDGNFRGEKSTREYSGNAARQVRPEWSNFPTEPPLRGGNDGLPDQLDGITFSKWRNESIKAYGNAVVPQVVYQIFKAIEAYESQ
jgi:DNA (cytosine-5)-methyltransferase 1